MKAKTYEFPCDCVAKKWRKGHCDPLRVRDMADGEFEIEGVFLNAKSVRELVALLVPKLIEEKVKKQTKKIK